MNTRLFKRRGSFIATAVIAMMLVFLINTGFQAYAQTQRKNEIKREESFQRPEPTRPISPEIPNVNRYQEDKVFLEYADSLYKVTTKNDTVQRQILKGNVKFRQSGMWMFCDSAYYYPEENSLDAFSNVRMEQGDTLFVYADKLFYNGDEHLAKLKNGPTRNKVTLINKDVTLTTDSLDYDLSIELGWYQKWGTIDDKVNTLTSLYGQYSPKTKLAEFFTDVDLVNHKDGFTMLTDTLYYSTETHIANIESRTLIQSENDTIVTNLATYYTDSGNADLLSRSLIIHRDSTGNIITLEGDSIIYDNATRISRAYMYKNPLKHSNPMVITDTAQKTTLIGGFGIYNDSTKEALATIYPLLMEYSQGDTLFLRADTIKTYIITEMVRGKRRRTPTESGFPENNGFPIVMPDSFTNKLWIDTTFFSVKIPYVETPLIMLLKAAPYHEPEEDIVETEVPEDEISPIEKTINELKGIVESIHANETSLERLVADTLMTSVLLDSLTSITDSIISEGDSVETSDVMFSQEEAIPVTEDSISNPDENILIIEEDITPITDTLIKEEKVDFKRESLMLKFNSLQQKRDSIDFIIHATDSLIDIKDKLCLRLDSLGLTPDSVALILDSFNVADDAVEIDEEAEKFSRYDSIPKDTHVVLAYHRGRFFKQDLQGVADSIVFVERDSMLYLFRKPIIWNEERQVTGNRIDVHFNDSTTDWAYLPEFGLMAEYVDEDFYNQIYGKEITAHFQGQGLRRMEVSGNVETIFLPQEEDSTFNRLVNAESSYMDVYLNENQLDWLKMWPEVSGTVTPIFLVKRNQMYLQKFKWWGFLRPQREWYGDRVRWADNLGEVPEDLEKYFLEPSDFGEPKSFTGTRVVLPPTTLPPAIDILSELTMDSLNNLYEPLDSVINPEDILTVPDSIQTGVNSPGVIMDEKTETIEDIEESEIQEEKVEKETENQAEDIEKQIEAEKNAVKTDEGLPEVEIEGNPDILIEEDSENIEKDDVKEP